MREKVIERKLIQAVRQCGGLALKFVSPGFNGVPDRLLLFMGGKVAFVEVKAPGESPRPLQAHRMEQLRRMGFKVYVWNRCIIFRLNKKKGYTGNCTVH